MKGRFPGCRTIERKTEDGRAPEDKSSCCNGGNKGTEEEAPESKIPGSKLQISEDRMSEGRVLAPVGSRGTGTGSIVAREEEEEKKKKSKRKKKKTKNKRKKKRKRKKKKKRMIVSIERLLTKATRLIKLTSKPCFHCSGSASAILPTCPRTPWLRTRPSSRPKDASARSTAF